jgi:hypothetical protein
VESFFLLLATVVGVAYVYGLWNLSFAALLSSVGIPAEAFAALLLAAISLRRKGPPQDRFSSAWTCFTLGIFLCFLAEAYYGAYFRFLGILAPYPSVADGFWLASYVPFIVGIVLLAWPFRKALTSRTIIYGTIAILGVATVALAVLVPPILSSGEPDFLTMSISLAYPLLAAVLLVIGVPVLLIFRGGTFWKPVLYMIIGTIILLVYDMLSLVVVYYMGHPIDMLYQWSYLAVALGFYLRARQVRSLSRT